MAVTAFMFGVPVKNQYDGTAVVDWDTDTIKCALATSTFTPNQDTMDFFNDVTNEVSGTGYSARGGTLTASPPARAARSQASAISTARPPSSPVMGIGALFFTACKKAVRVWRTVCDGGGSAFIVSTPV